MENKKNKIKPKNTFVTQAWTRKNSKESKFSRLKFISNYFNLYCHNSSLSSLKYLTDSNRPWFERIFWIIIHNLIISAVVVMVYFCCIDFLTTPLITSMETDSYKTTTLSFPGIAICSINRLSKHSAMNLATDIFNANITNYTINEICELIKHLGDLYTFTFKDVNRYVELNELLTTYYKGPYDVINIMKDLSPQCSMMLLKCKLYGLFRNCSDLFEFRRTQDGYCCTFNYARENDDIPELNDTKNPIDQYKVMDLGIERGLTVVMDPLVNDYFYSVLPITGWKVILFNPTDYPDMTTGGVSEIFGTPLSETFVDVTMTGFLSADVIQSFPKTQRNCIFMNEDRARFDGAIYTYSDCIADCIIRNIWKVCGCRPFIYTRRGKHEC
ncbi:sodium channel protein Nach [Monomorium pharaonis]|uniref:sodium channel protein Nach n=1 Tax=Monomorium pharaonis TaxID=307658 RepID=UPI001747BB82|nr:sodium channel protein Nach [Monomorium pharaonis]